MPVFFVWLFSLGLQDRPIHVISANMHSVLNTLYGYAAVKSKKKPKDIYGLIPELQEKRTKIRYA